ncbi:hypothetical protein T01_11881 [Trichinella spiralis]|uniref:Uncharacterized protein n=1 Tax=Trichinella spiralis TaxID=6334 RepID=A0A0V1AXN8_TRISP|nr:hypothetical protein T01_11881 [Trichinella spiralis]
MGVIIYFIRNSALSEFNHCYKCLKSVKNFHSLVAFIQLLFPASGHSTRSKSCWLFIFWQEEKEEETCTFTNNKKKTVP